MYIPCAMHTCTKVKTEDGNWLRNCIKVFTSMILSGLGSTWSGFLVDSSAVSSEVSFQLAPPSWFADCLKVADPCFVLPFRMVLITHQKCVVNMNILEYNLLKFMTGWSLQLKIKGRLNSEYFSWPVSHRNLEPASIPMLICEECYDWSILSLSTGCYKINDTFFCFCTTSYTSSVSKGMKNVAE